MTHPAMNRLRKLMTVDSASEKKQASPLSPEDRKLTMDAIASDYAARDTSLKATAVVQEWVEIPPDDLDPNEGYADRLYGMLLGFIDENQDGEITDEEQEVFDSYANAVGAYLSKKGVTDADIEKLLSDWDNEAAESIIDYLAGELDDNDADLDEMAFSPEEQEPIFDAVGKQWGISNGKKVLKKIQGFGPKVKRSIKQVMSLKKALRRAFSPDAMRKRAKSMRLQQKMGLNGK